MENLEIKKQIELLKECIRKINEFDEKEKSKINTLEKPKVKKIGTLKDARRISKNAKI